MTTRHEVNATLALVVRRMTDTHSTVAWEESENGDVTYSYSEAIATPGAEPGWIHVKGWPHLAMDSVVDWLLARFALTLATARAEEQRATEPGD